MASYGELFPGRKLKHEGDQGSPGREHDPGGPLDLDRGVVFLAPPAAEQAPGDPDRDTPTPDNATPDPADPDNTGDAPQNG